MTNNLNLEIKNFGLINEANIEINKINVIGGINSSGKSTASKLLYGFLKANSLKQREDLIKNFTGYLNGVIESAPHSGKPFIKFVSIHENLSDIIKTYNSYKDVMDDGLIEEMDYILELLSLSENELSSRLTLDYIKYGSLQYFVDKSFYHLGQEFGHGGSARLYCDNFESSVERIKLNDESTENNKKYDIEDQYFDYKTEGTLNNVYDVFYISSISIFDINEYYNGRSGISKNIFIC